MRANTGLNQGSITTRTVLAAVSTEWMFPSFAHKRHCQHSQIYCSKQFQLCTHPVSFTRWSEIHKSGQLAATSNSNSRVADLEWVTQITLSWNSTKYIELLWSPPFVEYPSTSNTNLTNAGSPLSEFCCFFDKFPCAPSTLDLYLLPRAPAPTLLWFS